MAEPESEWQPPRWQHPGPNSCTAGLPSDRFTPRSPSTGLSVRCNGILIAGHVCCCVRDLTWQRRWLNLAFLRAMSHVSSENGHTLAATDTTSHPPQPQGQQLCLTSLSPHLNTATTSCVSFQKGKSLLSLSLMSIKFPSCTQCEMGELRLPPLTPQDEPPNGNQLTHGYAQWDQLLADGSATWKHEGCRGMAVSPYCTVVPLRERQGCMLLNTSCVPGSNCHLTPTFRIPIMPKRELRLKGTRLTSG